jgi:tetratricopeptide (TPR) repeat protein
MTKKTASAGELIELEITRENWGNARKLIKAELRRDPDNHWLLIRLSLTYYEQREYSTALGFSSDALKAAPFCPLVLWNHAGTLQMLGRTNEALAIYQRLIRRGVDRIAFDACGEGMALARGMVADCHYRLADCYKTLKKPRQAVDAYKRHLAMRGPGCRSIYAISAVRKELNDLDQSLH